jgi:Transposase DDE domain
MMVKLLVYGYCVRYKLRTTIAAALYRMRKAIVEPVFGQIKSVRGLRRFLLRGLANVQDEFRRIAFTHNRLKLHRHRAA